MPMYLYKCHACGRRFQKFLPLAQWDEPQYCTCPAEEPAVKQLTAPMVQGDYPDYLCPVTGKLISGRKAHEENLKRTQCRILEPGEKEAAAKFRMEAERQLDRAIEQTAGQFVESLSGEKIAQLGRELEHGVELTVNRL